MKRTIGATVALSAALMIQSCAPVYKCGETVPEKAPGGKRLKAVIEERDVLCKNLTAEKSSNQSLTQENNKLKNEVAVRTTAFNELQENYNDLQSQKAMSEEQYTAELQKKAGELANKESQLADREKKLKEMQQIIARQDSMTQKLNDVLRNALLGFNSDELTVEVRNGKVYVSMSDKLLFKSGSAAVETKGKDALRVLADVLLKNNDIDVLIEGHTDNIPIKTAQYKDNWDLSVARATSIVRILTDEYYVGPTRVTASGKGEFSPRAANDTPEGRAKNRRTEIILSPKLDEIMQLLNK
jgi:chemotaxis protein MotB